MSTRSHTPGHERPSERPGPVSKRSLVAVSHAIEHAVLEGPVTTPTVVVAAFQHGSYLECEHAMYARLAAAGATVVLAYVDGLERAVPAGCHAVVLDEDEALTDEWSVIAVGPEAGIFLVAVDEHRFDPTASSLEAGRLFSGRWGCSHVQAGNELARMRAALGPRLRADVAATIDGLLARVMPTGRRAAASFGTDGEVWATNALRRMVVRMQDARAGSALLRAQLDDAHAGVTARAGARTDPRSGLHTQECLARWSPTGHLAALPVGVALFDVEAFADVEEHHDPRAAHHAARRVAAALTEPLAPVDVAVRVSDRHFAIVVPGASTRHLRRLVAVVAEQLELASDGYPYVPLGAAVASTVTVARPLPLDDLERALGHALEQALDGAPGSSSPTYRTRTDDPVTVVHTARLPDDATGIGSRDPADARPRTRELPADEAAVARQRPAPDADVETLRRADRAMTTLAHLPLRTGRA